MKNVMLISYDPEGDVLEVVFDESLQDAEQVAFKFRDGIVLYTTVNTLKPVQLTLVSYRALAEFPVIHFEGWDKLSKSDKASLSPILKSPVISAFLRIDPKSGNGHISSPDMLEILSAAA